MKNSSAAILAALGLAGAAGVYLATQDAADDEVSNVRTKSVDGSKGGVSTKGELCAQLREDIPAAKSRIAELEQELADFLASDALDLAQEYRAQIGGGSKRNARKRQEETLRYIETGQERTLTSSKQPTKRLADAIEDARTRVVALETSIQSVQKNLTDFEADELDLISEGAC